MASDRGKRLSTPSQFQATPASIPIQMNVSTDPTTTVVIPTDFTTSLDRRSTHSNHFPHDIYDDLQSMQEEEKVVIRRLLESWMDRLQLISVLAVFFASLEATLLSITMPQDQGNTNLSAGSQAVNVCLTSGLLLHILAAFVSFLGGFFLIRYRIKWAKVEQKAVIRTRKMQRRPGSFNFGITVENLHQSPIEIERSESSVPVPMPMPVPQTTGWDYPPHASARSHPPHRIGQRQGPSPRNQYRFRDSYRTPTEESPDFGFPSTFHPLPTRLLSRFHSLCITLTLLGSLFSLISIIVNAWQRLPHVVGIVGTIITVTTLLTTLCMMFIPDRDHEQENVPAPL